MGASQTDSISHLLEFLSMLASTAHEESKIDQVEQHAVST